MGCTPGGGTSLLRLAVVNACALGFGLTDGVFFTFVIQTLMVAGAPSFSDRFENIIAYAGIALGGLLAMIFAPMASVGSTTPNRRAVITFAMLSLGAFCCAGLGVTFSKVALGLKPEIAKWKVYVGVALAGLYRAFVQASPVVPCVMDAAKTRGDEENYPLRRDISLSFFYLEYRIGLVASQLSIACLPDNYLGDLFPIMLTASTISVVLTTMANLTFPREKAMPMPMPQPADFANIDSDVLLIAETLNEAEKPKPLPPFKERVREHMNAALFQADKRLLACYVELFYYGVAFGQLAFTVPCFFNDVVFKNVPGDPQGFKWSAYTSLIGMGLSMILDASLPALVFRKGARKFSMTVAWVLGALAGCCLFITMMFVTTTWPAMFVFVALHLSTSTHKFFTLLSCGSLVEPKYRGTSFSVRAGAENAGIFVGTLCAGFISAYGGWKWVMFHSATACFGAMLAAAFSGSIERQDYAGVAANSNMLWKYLAFKFAKRSKPVAIA